MDPWGRAVSPGADPARGRLVIVPLGRVDDVAVRVAAGQVQAVFNLPVDVSDPRPEPEYALIPARRQYDAGAIIKALAADPVGPAWRLGLTEADLCLPFLTHVYGESQLGGRAAVVSPRRLRIEPGGGRAPIETLYERLAKVVLHEVGHLRGLVHCPRSGCLMNFSLGLDQLDQLMACFCPDCERRLGLRGGKADP
ncbi:MAG: zinc metallopeptidase [Proteobacteria bacterium]|nr:zinc metallopeptidase [Pseudomonadota bacterium]